jgi:ATP-dependent Lhr-like helicase
MSTLGPAVAEEVKAATVGRQWLDRYGIVTRECWKKERPPVSWRSIYLELKKLEFRGEARRGYFVKGLSGAQFAAPAAVELLRATAAEESAEAPFVVLSTSDPANVYNMAIAATDQDPLSRPRGGGALLVTRRGKVAIAVEGRGRRITIAEWMKAEEVEQAKELLSAHLRGEKGARYLMLPDIRPT